MRWIPKFGMRWIFVAFTFFGLFSALNIVPWHSATTLHISDGGCYDLDQYSCGFPFTYIQYYSGDELTPELAEDLDPTNPNGAFSTIVANRKLRLIDNVVVSVVLFLVISFTFRAAKKRRARRTSFDVAG